MRKSDSPHKTTEKLDATKPRRYCRRYRGEGGRRESGYENSACESHLGSLALFFSTYLGNAQWAFPARPGHHHSKYPVLRLPRGSERAAGPRPDSSARGKHRFHVAENRDYQSGCVESNPGRSRERDQSESAACQCKTLCTKARREFLENGLERSTASVATDSCFASSSPPYPEANMTFR